MKSLSDTLKEATLTESRTTGREMYKYVANWLYDCDGVEGLKEMLDNIIGGLNHGIEDLKKYDAEGSKELYERASEFVEQVENIYKKMQF